MDDTGGHVPATAGSKVHPEVMQKAWGYFHPDEVLLMSARQKRLKLHLVLSRIDQLVTHTKERAECQACLTMEPDGAWANPGYVRMDRKGG